jgi:hypothetical protein
MPSSPSLNPSAAVKGTSDGVTTITSATLTTTVSNTVIIACVFTEKTTTSVSSVASVTGGLSFTRYGGERPSATCAVDIWYLFSTGTFSDTIKATLNAAAGNAVIVCFGVQGCAGLTLTTAFDQNASLPATGTGTTSPAAVTYSTSQPDDLIVYALGNGSTTASVSIPGTPTGFTSIATQLENLGSGSLGCQVATLSVTSTQSGASASATMTTVGTWAGIVFAFTANSGAVIDEPNPFNQRSFPSQWSPTGRLLMGTAQDISQPETNTHFIPRAFPPQWGPLRSLEQGTAQDLTSPAVETNVHWIGKPWPIQWCVTRALEQNVNDAPIPPQSDTPTYHLPVQWSSQWSINRSLVYGTAQDLTSPTVETNQNWIGTAWIVKWSLQQSLLCNPAVDVPSTQVDTPTYFSPRQLPPQWNLNRSLAESFPQEFSTIIVEGGVYSNLTAWAPAWAPQWNLQRSLLQGTAQDFSSTPPIVTGVHYVQTGRAKIIVQIGIS